MNTNRIRIPKGKMSIALMAVCASLSAACGAQPQRPTRPTATPDPWIAAQAPGVTVTPPAVSAIKTALTDKQSPLNFALELLPDTTTALSFTDWGQIRRNNKAEGITSQTPPAEAKPFIDMLRNQTPFAAYGFAQINTHAKDWGWNSLDLEWEAAARVLDVPVYVLKLRDDFDLTALTNHFQERHFNRFSYQGATVFSFGLGANSEWISTTQRAIFNTAIFEEQKVLVLSFQGKAVQAVLDVNAQKGKSLASVGDLKSTSALLGDSFSAFIARGAVVCKSTDAFARDLGLTSALLDQVRKEDSASPGLHTYSSIAVGYQVTNATTAGTIVMHFGQAKDAQSDLQARQKLATSGVSINNGQVYSNVFTINSAEVKDNDIVFAVHPTNNTPKALWAMIQQQDMLYARCPQTALAPPSSNEPLLGKVLMPQD